MKKRFNLKYIYIAIALVMLNITAIYAESPKLSSQPEVQTFIQSMVERYQFDGNSLTNLLDSTPIMLNIIANMQHPYEEQPWYIYRDHLVSDKRIAAGVQYWQKHKDALNYAEKKYGVSANIIVAIIGVESFYGQTRLKYPVLSSLVTLSFAYPPRSDFFKKELEQYLLLTRDLGIDPRSIFGSYAGAIGLPQFMPSNYRKYAVSYRELTNKEGENINQNLGDLTTDNDDVVISVANFLQHFGWEKDKLIAVRAKVKGDQYQKIIAKKLAPKLTIAQLKKYGVTPSKKIPADYKNCKAMLIQLQNQNDFEYWLGFENFHVLSRYNGDRQYIMAVYQLAMELEKNNY